MSKLRSDYDSTKWGKFLAWVNGTVQEDASEDVKLDTVDTTIDSHTDMHRPESSDPVKDETEALEHTFLADTNIYHDYVDTFTTKSLKIYRKFYKAASVVICLSIIAILLYTVSFLPHFGDPNNPANNEVPARYIEKGLQETGAVNIVTGMILDYRAFDTFGESNVLYIAACTVLVLLRLDTKNGKKTKQQEEAEEEDKIFEPKHDLILQKVASILVPPILIYGIYVVLNGHLSPGGGFSGGAIIGAAIILYLNAFGFEKTQRFFSMKTFKGVTFGALSFYALSKSYSFFTGANHLHSGIPLGTPGNILSSGLILPLNICVGLVVAVTMYGFYAIFRKGGI